MSPSFLFQRLLSALAVVFGVVSLVFLLLQWLPGDPVELMVGENTPAADRQALRQALGLDVPIGQRYASYLGSLLQLDPGTSIHQRRAVMDLLAERLPATIQLAALALAIALPMALALGMLAAVRRGSGWDLTASSVAMLGIAIPNFALGPMLILGFSVGFGWFPVSGSDAPGSWVLPALTLGTGLAAVTARMLRSSMLEVLNEDFVRTARAKGLSERRVLIGHAMRNALLPVITVIGMQLGALLGGAVITETVFSWPGIGSLLIESIQTRDYPVVQAIVLLIAVSYVLINLLTDLIYAWVDPRVQIGEAGRR